MKKIRKAIIPAAGLGTRMLPISYAVPKEMLPIVDLPAVYHLVKEAVDSGLEDILIITNRGKEAMESFFDRSTEYECSARSRIWLTSISSVRRRPADSVTPSAGRENSWGTSPSWSSTATI